MKCTERVAVVSSFLQRLKIIIVENRSFDQGPGTLKILNAWEFGGNLEDSKTFMPRNSKNFQKSDASWLDTLDTLDILKISNYLEALVFWDSFKLEKARRLFANSIYWKIRDSEDFSNFSYLEIWNHGKISKIYEPGKFPSAIILKKKNQRFNDIEN